MCKYSKTVVANSEATDDEVAVAYLMLKEAEGNLKTYSADDLNDLLKAYQKIYDGNNILNDDLYGDGSNEEDYIYDGDTYSDFTYAYGEALDVVDSKDIKEITDAYELLEQKKTALSELKTVRKVDFANVLAQFQQEGKKEFDYNTWERVTVKDSGTVYDDQTYSWGMLFYHVYSAYDKINAQFELIKDNKTLDKTSNTEIYAAYEACKEAVDVLSHTDRVKRMNTSYRSEDDVLNIINKTYKHKLLGNEQFVRGLMKASILGTYSEHMFLTRTKDKDGKYVYSDKLSEIDTKLQSDPNAVSLSSFVKNDQITIYSDWELYVTSAGQVNLTKTSTSKADTSIKLVGTKGLPDFVQVLGQMTTGTGAFNWHTYLADNTHNDADLRCGFQENEIWDGNYACTNEDPMGDGSKLVKGGFTVLNPVMVAAASGGKVVNGWFKNDTTSATSGGPLPCSASKNATTTVEDSTTVLNCHLTSDAFMTPMVAVALATLAGKGYITDKSSGYDGKEKISDNLVNSDKRKESEYMIINSKDVKYDALGDKVSATEWKIIGNYLTEALDLWLTKPEVKTYTVADADKLIDDSDKILETTSESAVFAELNDALVDARKALIEEANRKRTQKKDTVDTETYKKCKTAKENLEKALEAFHYDYAEVQATLAKVAKELDDSTSEIAGDANIKDLMEKVALELISVEDLKCKDDADDLVDDVLNSSDEFAGYNRVYTKEGDFTIGEYKVDKAKGGPNVAHYNLTRDYEALLAAYQAATETAGKDVNYDVNGDNATNTKDVVAFAAKLANEETLDVATYDFNGDGKVDVKDPAKLLDLILNEQV